MWLPSILLCLLLVALVNAENQAVTVKGIINCRGHRQPGTFVQLYDSDSVPLIDDDDLLGSVIADHRGVFCVKGFTNEFTEIEPYILIEHNCGYEGLNEKHVYIHDIPVEFITIGEKAKRVYHLGDIELLTADAPVQKYEKRVFIETSIDERIRQCIPIYMQYKTFYEKTIAEGSNTHILPTDLQEGEKVGEIEEEEKRDAEGHETREFEITEVIETKKEEHEEVNEQELFRQEEEKRQAKIREEEEQILREQERIREEDRRIQEEQRRIEEERIRDEERRVEEERRKEEQKRIEEERRIQEEQRLEAERKREEEVRQYEIRKKEIEEERRKQQEEFERREALRQEQIRLREEEIKRREEEAKRHEEERARLAAQSSSPRDPCVQYPVVSQTQQQTVIRTAEARVEHEYVEDPCLRK